MNEAAHYVLIINSLMPQKDILLASLLCFGVFLCFMNYTLIAPLLPGELIRRDISSIYSGIIMGFYSVISVPMAPLIPKYFYPRMGYMPVYTLGLFVISVANLSYGFCFYFPYEQKGLFIGMNIFFRLCQGMGMALLYQTCFTLMGLIYKQNIGRAITLITLATTMGVAVGPTVAGLLYSLFGYVGPFFALGSVMLLFAFLSLSLKPDQNSFSTKPKSHSSSQVTYSSFCKNKVSLIDGQLSLVALITFFLRMIMITFYEPTLAVKLELVFGFDSDQSAYFYSLLTVFAFTTTLILTFCPIKTRSERWSLLGLAGGIISVLLMGPSALLHLPENIYIMGAGTAMLGIFGQILGIACVLCCAQSMKEQYPNQDHKILQLLGSLRSCLAGLSLMISPFFASTVQNLLSYSTLCDIVSGVLLILLIALACVNRAHQRTKWIRQNSSLTEGLLKETQEK